MRPERPVWHYYFIQLYIEGWIQIAQWGSGDSREETEAKPLFIDDIIIFLENVDKLLTKY